MKIDTNKAAELLNKSTKMPTCPLCGHKHFQIAQYLFQLPEYGKSPLEDAYVYPVLPLTCENCGSVYFINAIKLGLVDAVGDENENK